MLRARAFRFLKYSSYRARDLLETKEAHALILVTHFFNALACLLAFGSPAVDACDSGLGTDLDNQLRPFGEGYDMGAYEQITYWNYFPVVLPN